MDAARGIGRKGSLPWHLPGELKHFKSVTTKVDDSQKKNAVIMGRKTWESIPEKFRPLPGRFNIILSRNPDFVSPEGVLVFDNFQRSLEFLDSSGCRKNIEKVFVIGGAQIVTEAVKHPLCQKIYLTHLQKQYDCDVFFPEFESRFNSVSQGEVIQEDQDRYYFAEYRPKE
ncbi:MAG: dihydrofolate reductase [Candidatus Omnitrophica bacterium]|nr:dihydrofolate reductase [Candidatus Omnitrophota bacterium]